ncbi:stage II sporulation protein D [Paenibacillus sp. sptzw28]|nr:stage II sporulation protein D [Paenibacillus sp. sptzw28]
MVILVKALLIQWTADESAGSFTGTEAIESEPIQENAGAPAGQAVQIPGKTASEDRGLPDTKSRTVRNPAAGLETYYVSDYERIRVRVYLTEEKRVETLPIELYVRGVIAGEMPVDFELEALKAQAIAARTYIYRRLLSGDRSDMPSDSGSANVTDTVQNQVYFSVNKLLNLWDGQTKEANLEKLNRAVEETKGQIITYRGEPIQAAFFSTSNGYTENASDYWNVDLPYLHSVASPWDKAISPRFKETVTLGLREFAEKLGVKESEVSAMRVLELTEGKRIKTVAVGGNTFSGREVREKLGLASSQFTWKINNNKQIIITTFGYGHGVGMSQWGANGMARSGHTARQIVTYYYSGTQVEQASKLPNRH